MVRLGRMMVVFLTGTTSCGKSGGFGACVSVLAGGVLLDHSLTGSP
jgi:hypothetical protein